LALGFSELDVKSSTLPVPSSSTSTASWWTAARRGSDSDRGRAPLPRAGGDARGVLPDLRAGNRRGCRRARLSCTVAELDAFYVENFPRYADRVEVNPQAAPVLEALERQGVLRAVVTNTVSTAARAIVENAGLARFFPVMACADHVDHAKPAPDLLHFAMKALGVNASESWMIGDSRYDARRRGRGSLVRRLGIDGDHRIDALGALAELSGRPNPTAGP